MEVTKEVLRVLDEVLSLNGLAASVTPDTPLLGAIPELDSMAVVTLITTLEEHFGLVVDEETLMATPSPPWARRSNLLIASWPPKCP